MSKYCANCGRPNDDAVRFCSECGHEFEVETNVGPSFCGAFFSCLANYCKIGGRATRAEYWGWLVVYGIISALFAGAAVAIQQRGLSADYLKWTLNGCAVWCGLTLIPGLAVAARRLHDSNKTGWRVWIPGLFAAAGCVAVVYYMTNGTFKLDADLIVDQARDFKKLLAGVDDWATFKALGKSVQAALACWALAGLSGLLLAIRLCFVPGSKEENRYGVKQVNP